MLGIVLCGGKSTRMGNDKGLLKLEARTWAQTAIDKMSALHIPVKISVNNDQHDSYAKVFPAAELVRDNTTIDLRGPLLGTLSCHLNFPGEDLFLLACDLPLMEISILEELQLRYQQSPSSDVYIFTNEGEPEPLCGIYTSNGLDTIVDMLRQNKLTKHSMKFMLEHLRVNAISMREDQKKYFRNFNAHAELNGL